MTRQQRPPRVYISGRMSSATPQDFARNVQTFHDAARRLRQSGLRVVNPARCWPCRFPRLYRLMERVLGQDRAYRTVLAYDLLLLALRADSVCHIAGWPASRGARIEHHFANLTAIPHTHTYFPSTDTLANIADLQRQRKERRQQQKEADRQQQRKQKQQEQYHADYKQKRQAFRDSVEQALHQLSEPLWEQMGIDMRWVWLYDTDHRTRTVIMSYDNCKENPLLREGMAQQFYILLQRQFSEPIELKWHKLK